MQPALVLEMKALKISHAAAAAAVKRAAKRLTIFPSPLNMLTKLKRPNTSLCTNARRLISQCGSQPSQDISPPVSRVRAGGQTGDGTAG